MGNVRDDQGKKMDPLFPRLHISDAEKGGPRTPPRNKMAISQNNVVSSSSSRISSHLGPQTSSYHDASYKRSVFSSSFGAGRATRMATRLDHTYHQSSGINLNISLTTVKQTIETTNCHASDYRLYKPQDQYRSTRNTLMKINNEDTDDIDYLIPSLSFGNEQNYTNRRKLLNPINVGPKLLELTDNNKDITQENKLINATTITDITEEPGSEMLSREPSPSHAKKISISTEEPQTLLHKRKSVQENTRCKNGNIDTTSTDDHEDGVANDKNEERGVSLETDAGKVGDNITPEEVSQRIGPQQYCRLRRTIIQQEKAFQSQVFELHRLIKVQKVLAGSHKLLREDGLKKTRYEDMLRQVNQDKRKKILTIPIDSTTTKKTNNDTEKLRYYPSLLDFPPPPPPPPAASVVINTSKQPPWCYLPPPPQPGNQWLVPVRSPSEGLVYKPYTGPSPPFITPVYGIPSNDHFHTTTTTNNPYQQGIGMFPIPNTPPLFTSYGLPTLSKHFPSPTTIENINDVNNYNSTKTSLLTPDNKEMSDMQQGSSGSNNYSCDQRVIKDELLPLFPTTPMLHHADDDQCDDERPIKVIKVIPHNPKVAYESAARIFQFIQEERKHNVQ